MNLREGDRPCSCTLVLTGGVDKYGQKFSDLSSLLSSDHRHYAALPALRLRCGVLHLLVIAALASLQ